VRKDLLYKIAYDEAVRALSEQRVLAILWPRNWDVTANPREVIETFIESAGTALVEQLHRDLSLHMHNSYLENRQGLEQLALLFEIAGALMAVEVVLWIAAIASST